MKRILALLFLCVTLHLTDGHYHIRPFKQHRHPHLFLGSRLRGLANSVVSGLTSVLLGEPTVGGSSAKTMNIELGGGLLGLAPQLKIGSSTAATTNVGNSESSASAHSGTSGVNSADSIAIAKAAGPGGSAKSSAGTQTRGPGGSAKSSAGTQTRGPGGSAKSSAGAQTRGLRGSGKSSAVAQTGGFGGTGKSSAMAESELYVRSGLKSDTGLGGSEGTSIKGGGYAEGDADGDLLFDFGFGGGESSDLDALADAGLKFGLEFRGKNGPNSKKDLLPGEATFTNSQDKEVGSLRSAPSEQINVREDPAFDTTYTKGEELPKYFRELLPSSDFTSRDSSETVTSTENKLIRFARYLRQPSSNSASQFYSNADVMDSRNELSSESRA